MAHAASSVANVKSAQKTPSVARFQARCRLQIRTPKGQQGFFTPASIVAMQLLYPTLTRYTFLLFSCRTLVGEQGLFLREDLSMRCYEGAHLYWAVGLGLPSLLIYVFGFPIAKFVAVYKRRHRLEDDHTKAKYGFLINGFNPSTYYWEVVVDARKLLMSAIAVFLESQRNYTKTIVVVLLCVASYCLQVLLVCRHETRSIVVSCCGSAENVRTVVHRRAE